MELHNTKLINLGETVVSLLSNICLIVIFCFALGGCGGRAGKTQNRDCTNGENGNRCIAHCRLH